MGNSVFQDIKDNSGSQLKSIDHLLTKNFFEKQCVVGKGGFGRVWKVQSKKFNNQIYALKEMSKARIIARRSLASILLERTILSKLSHPFIVNIKSAFQDRENVYLVMDYCSGGDMRFHLPFHCFNEAETRFMTACMILALEYIHSQGIVHRDIKPENLVFDEKGYLKLTDFGISRATKTQSQIQSSRDQSVESNIGDIVDTSGTPGYMSPEAMCKLPHGPASDFFALGVIVYEMMFRKRPYSGPNKQQIRDNILAKQVQIKVHEIPDNWSIEAADFANKLIRRKPQNRLGFTTGIAELRTHPWFKDFDWNALLQRKMKAPWVPPKTDNYKVKSTDFQGDDQEVMAEAEILVRKDSVQKLFDGYYFQQQQQMQAMSFQQEKDKMRQKVCIESAKEQIKKSRNSINVKKLISPSNKINKVMNIDVNEKNFNKMKPQHQRNGSSDSTAISSQNSKSSTIKVPRLMKSQSPTSIVKKQVQ